MSMTHLRSARWLWVGVAAATWIAIAGSGPAEAKGCIKGALVGGVAGHYAGRHGVLGAAAGCLVGRHEANKRDRQRGAALPPR